MQIERSSYSFIVSNSTEILKQLGSGGFRRVDLRTVIVDTGNHALDRIREEVFDAVILDRTLPDGDALDFCRQIKLSPGRDSVPVLVVCEGMVSKDMLTAVVGSGCDGVLCTPLSRGQLYDVLAEPLGLPRRCQRRVVIRSPVRARGTLREVKGAIQDLTASGARIVLKEPFGGDPELKLIMETGPDQSFEVDGVVVWNHPHGQGAELAVQFRHVSPSRARQLEALTTWQVEQHVDQQWVVLQQNLTERSNFEGLAGRLAEEAYFDLRHVSLINSMGVSRWVSFLREIPDKTQYHLVHCSVAFCTQASFNLSMLGRGRMISFFTPYYCRRCDCEREQEFHVSSLDAQGSLPPVSCSFCEGRMLFDTIPEQYLLFLRQKQPG